MEKLIHDTFSSPLGDTGDYESRSVIRTENGDVWYADMIEPTDDQVDDHAEIVRRVNLHEDLVSENVKLREALDWALDHCQPSGIDDRNMSDYPERFRSAVALLSNVQGDVPGGAGASVPKKE